MSLKGQQTLNSFFAKANGNNGDVKRKNTQTDDLNESIKRIKADPIGKLPLQKLKGYQYSKKSDGAEEDKETIDQELRSKFYRKLGGVETVDDIKRRRTGEKVKPNQKVKLTPFQQQIADLKLKYPDTILVFEVGYQYKFFGIDAQTISQEFSLTMIPGRLYADDGHPEDEAYNEFARCTFTARSNYGVNSKIKALVDRGYRVGLITQSETAALKAAGSNKSGPFSRELSQLFTTGTYIEEGPAESRDDLRNINSGYLLGICQNQRGSEISIIAVQTSTGDIIYDEFSDSALLTELETRLIHIHPCELLLIGDITAHTKRMLENLSSSRLSSGNYQVRFTNLDKLENKETSLFLKDFYVSAMQTSSTASKMTTISSQWDRVQSLPEGVKTCIHSMINYLKDFGLEHIFDLTNNFSSFSSWSHMKLNGNVLTSLEIFYNQTDYREKGSLFWVLDHTRTPFGQRLLKKWIGKPLLDKGELKLRLDAVTELMSGYNGILDNAVRVMKGLYDLEQSLARVYYQKSTRKQLYYLLSNLSFISSSFKESDPQKIGFKSNILNELFAILPSCRESASEFLSKISKDAAVKDFREGYFNDEVAGYDNILDAKMLVGELENELDKYLKELRKDLGMPQLEYVSVLEETHLIKVKNAMIRKVPVDWVKHSKTNSESRFTSTRSRELIKQLRLHKEQLEVQCDLAYNEFLKSVASHYEEYRSVILAIANLDCLMSLAAVSGQSNYVRAKFVDESCVRIKQGRHPMVEQILLDNFVPNDVSMHGERDRALIVTGPNMGGKSSYVRQIALICIMAQIGCYVPAENAELGMVDAIYTRMGAYDNMMRGESTFMVELKECSDIMNAATSRSLVILDEIGRGTGTMDGVAIAYAVLSHFVTECKSLTLFITHYPMLSKIETLYPDMARNYHMGFLERQGQDGEPEITFLYLLQRGVAHRSYGLNVARLADIPTSIISRARIKSKEVEQRLDCRQKNKANSLIMNFMHRAFHNPQSLKSKEIEQLHECFWSEHTIS